MFVMPYLRLQPWIDRFAFQRQDSEHAFVYAPEGFPADKALQSFYAESKLTKRERSLGSQATRA